MNPVPRARLGDFRESSGTITFRIVSAPDFEATIADLKRQIPSWARQYNPRLHEWRIKVQYRQVVEELFTNVPHAQMAAVRRERGGAAPSEEAEQRSRTLWVLVSIAIIVGVGLFLWTRAPQMMAALEAPATPDAPALEVVAPPTPGPLEGRVTGNSNLREGPGVEYPISGKAGPGDNVSAIARARSTDGYWWLLLSGQTWIRSDLVVRASAGELPLDISTLPDYSGQYGTEPTAIPRPSATPTPPVAPTGTPATTAAAGARVPPALSQLAVQPAQVVWVTDGDTIRVLLEGVEYRVRYIGMDTPEEDETYFAAARDANARMVQDRTVWLEKDVSETDRYGRLLRYIWLEDGSLVNELLVRQGWAMAASFPPDIKYQPILRAAERSARTAASGVWQ